MLTDLFFIIHLFYSGVIMVTRKIYYDHSTDADGIMVSFLLLTEKKAAYYINGLRYTVYLKPQTLNRKQVYYEYATLSFFVW